MINKVMFYCKFLELGRKSDNIITHGSDLKDASLLLMVL